MGSKWRSKKGSSLVEVLAAVLILAVVVTGVLTGIGLSQRVILSEGAQGTAAAQAQDLADRLIEKLHGVSSAAPGSITADGAVYVEPGAFPDSSKGLQYTFEAVSVGAVGGYRIQTAAYYTDSSGKKAVQLTAFAAKDGD